MSYSSFSFLSTSSSSPSSSSPSPSPSSSCSSSRLCVGLGLGALVGAAVGLTAASLAPSLVRCLSSSSSSSEKTSSESDSHPSVLPWKYADYVPAVGTLLSSASSLPALFRPLKLRGLTLKNRIGVSPMCQYSSPDGFLTDWHLVHLGQYAIGGAALIIQEATAVEPNGRISPFDAGLWKDEHITQQKRIVDFIHSQKAAAGIQLAHAGRKASTKAPFLTPANVILTRDYCKPNEEEKGWADVVAPSAIPFAPEWFVPLEMTIPQIKQVTQSFVAAARRAEKAGFDYVEIHAAHGYLLNEFLSPLSNQRTDEYGGSFENRIRLLLEVTEAVRAVWPAEKPLAVRLSFMEWVDGGWGLEDSLKLVERLIPLGVDQIDCSSGGNNHQQKIPVGPGFQVPFAQAVKEKFGGRVTTATVGLITDPKQSNEIVEKGQADMVFLARQFLRDPHFPLHAAAELGVDIATAPQYQRGKVYPKK